MFIRSFRAASPLLMWLILFGIGAALGHAQSVTAQPPPGTSASDFAVFVGWLRFIFGIIAVALIVLGCISIAKHPASGIFEFIGALICIVIAGSAQSWVTALYHGGTG